jgi:hypothetical protein
MAAPQVMSLSGQHGTPRVVELAERRAHTTPGVFIIIHLAKEGDARPL